MTSVDSVYSLGRLWKRQGTVIGQNDVLRHLRGRFFEAISSIEHLTSVVFH